MPTCRPRRCARATRRRSRLARPNGWRNWCICIFRASRLRLLPVAPRQIPYNAGYHYFELDTGGELWRQLEKSSGLALHVAGDLPGLAMECWAIRG